MTREINQAGIDLIKSVEGWFPNAYRDPVGVVTIGWGHTKTAKMGQTITKEFGEIVLRGDLGEAEDAVNRMIEVPLTDNQFGALVSFAFNCGVGALGGSTLRKKLNAGDYASVPSELAKWNHGGGKVLPGLTRRRKAEGDLFKTPSGEVTPDPESKLVSININAPEGVAFNVAVNGVNLAR